MAHFGFLWEKGLPPPHMCFETFPLVLMGGEDPYRGQQNYIVLTKAQLGFIMPLFLVVFCFCFSDNNSWAFGETAA